jgi:hypothetical protein
MDGLISHIESRQFFFKKRVEKIPLEFCYMRDASPAGIEPVRK